MTNQKRVKEATALADHKALLIHKEELKKSFFCGCCGLGFNDIEEYKHHYNDDEEHNYHVERRREIMVPGLGYCAACAQIIQTSTYWKTHSEGEKHSKCIASLEAIGITGDYSQPLGCTVSGQLGEPMFPSKINGSGALEKGYSKASNCAGQPIIGLNFVKPVSPALTNTVFKCEVCDTTFRYIERLQHLAGIKHRLSYLEKYYSEWHVEVLKVPEVLKQRIKNRLSYFAHKVDVLERENETPDAKALREKFFNLEKFLQESKNDRKTNVKQNQGRHDAGRGRGYVHMAHNSRPLPMHGQRSGPSRFEAPFPRPDGRSQGYDGPRFGSKESFPPPKRVRTSQYEMDQAMEAINVLERFSVIQAEQEVRDKMQRMRDAVMGGSRLSDVQGYSDMMSSIKGHSEGPPHSVGEASFPPGYLGGSAPEHMMHQGHRPERPGHYRR